MNWNFQLIGTRAAVSAALVQHTEFPLATGVAKYVAFANDPSPWVRVKTVGQDANVKMLRIDFFTPAAESPVEVVPTPATPPPEPGPGDGGAPPAGTSG